MRTHRQIDELNLALGFAIAQKLRVHPELFDTVVRPRLTAGGRLRKAAIRPVVSTSSNGSSWQ